MLEFKKLGLEDIDIVKSFFNYPTNMACDNTIGGAFIWRDIFCTEYSITDGTIVFKVNYLDNKAGFISKRN